MTNCASCPLVQRFRPDAHYMQANCTLYADPDTLNAHSLHTWYRPKHTKCTLIGMHTIGREVAHLCRPHIVTLLLVSGGYCTRIHLYLILDSASQPDLRLSFQAIRIAKHHGGSGKSILFFNNQFLSNVCQQHLECIMHTSCLQIVDNMQTLYTPCTYKMQTKCQHNADKWHTRR